MNTIDYKIKDTFDVIACNGILSSKNAIYSLYSYILSHVDEMSEISMFQVTGSVLAEIAYAKMEGFTRIPHMAYYCLTRGVSAIQPIGYQQIIMDNMFKSIEGRLKLMFRGADKLISDRVSLIKNLSPQETYDFAHMCDYIVLKNQGFSSSERWWQLAVEDVGEARNNYPNYSDDQIIAIGRDIHDKVANQVLLDLKTYARDYGFI